MLFENIKEGDRVLLRKAKMIVAGGWGTQVNATVYIEQTITRITATQLTTDAGRFARRDGRQIGGNDVVYPLGYQVKEYGEKARTLVATPPEHLAQLDYLHTSIYEMERAIDKLNRQSRPLMRALALKGKQPEGFEEVIGIVQDATNAVSALLKHVPKP